ncbi:hypothetical protein PENTCL1PPCAC_18205, partial [Pristionchus entomophagus]
ERFIEVTFLWKYEEPSHEISKGIPNIIEATFVPQKELFNDPRLTAFITHAGAGSMVEFLHAGVPVIVVPLAGEQSRDSAVESRCSGRIWMIRTSSPMPSRRSSHPSSIIQGMLRYKAEAVRISRRLKDQPFSARERVLRNMVFMARHGPLHFLNHHGMGMSLFSFYSLDVYLTLLLSIILLISLPLFIFSIIARSLFRIMKR